MSLLDLPGCTVVLEGIPPQALFGINFQFYTHTAEARLHGIKNIPAGLAFFHLSLDGGTSIRHGFIFDAASRRNKVLLLTWDAEAETVVVNGAALDAHLHGLWLTYPYMINFNQPQLSPETALASFVNEPLVSRILSSNGNGFPMSSLFASKQENTLLSQALLASARERVRKRLGADATAVALDEEVLRDPIIQSLQQEAVHEMNLWVVDKKQVRPHATPAQITEDAMDRTWYLGQCVKVQFEGDFRLLLGEFQLCFHLMVLYSNYCAYLQWLQILQVFAHSDRLFEEARGDNLTMVIALLDSLSAQLRVMPAEYLLATGESLIDYDAFSACIKRLYQTITAGSNYSLLQAVGRVKALLVTRFAMADLDRVMIDLDDSDEGPVVV